MQNQQLQDQIRKLIGAPAPTLAPAAAPVALGGSAPVEPFAVANDMANSQSARPFLNLNNPRVQEALDRLMKNGINQPSMVLTDPRTAVPSQGVDTNEPFPIHGGGPGGSFGGPYGASYSNHYGKYDSNPDLGRSDRSSHYSGADGRY